MTPEARRRYARHLLLAEIGEPGQSRLAGHRVAVGSGGAPRAAQVARAYLARAGVSVPADRDPVVPDAAAIEALAGRPELTEAASFLAGAFSAVEELKRALDVGRPGRLDVSLDGADPR